VGLALEPGHGAREVITRLPLAGPSPKKTPDPFYYPKRGDVWGGGGHHFVTASNSLEAHVILIYKLTIQWLCIEP